MPVDEPPDPNRGPANRGPANRGPAERGPVQSWSWEPVRPVPRFDHLHNITHAFGLWEHAEITTPRVAHGFCTDDNARALIVVCREESPSPVLDELASTYLGFVLDAQMAGGRFHNRRGPTGAWLDDVGSDDCQGRALWALGVAVNRGRQPWVREAALAAFSAGAAFVTPHLRANAFAVLGASALLEANPGHVGARRLLRRSVDPLATAARGRVPWCEARLTYDNARLPEALLAAGSTLGDARLIRAGLRLLTWLSHVETSGDHFSFVPHGGWAPDEERPGFDQQPVEAAAMAEACHRAFRITGDPPWWSRSFRAAQWFVGRNDLGLSLYDATTGGTCDGLMRDGVNENQGAESTLAGLAALQVTARLGREFTRPAH